MLKGSMEEQEVQRLRQGIQSQIYFLQNLTETETKNDLAKLIVSNLQSILDDDDQHQMGLEVPLKSLTLRDVTQNPSIEVSSTSASTISPHTNNDGKATMTFDTEGQSEGMIDQEMKDGDALVDPLNIPRRSSCVVQLVALLEGDSTKVSSTVPASPLFSIDGEKHQKEKQQQKLTDAFTDLGVKIGRSRGGSWPSTSNSKWVSPRAFLQTRPGGGPLSIHHPHHHGPQQCPYCPRVLNNVGNWRRHVLTMHFAREKPKKCRHCASCFRTVEYLQQHYVRSHNYPLKMARKCID